MEIRAKCRRLKQRDNLKLVVIDYLQLMSSGKRVESRQQEVSEFSRALKLLAKELEVPVIAISQLNRGPEQRTDKKPAMSDLRESGSIEQDADMVILLHREAAYERESPREGEADLIGGLAVQQDHHVGVLLDASLTLEGPSHGGPCRCAARGHGSAVEIAMTGTSSSLASSLRGRGARDLLLAGLDASSPSS